eukprot:XP_025001575.1 cohesin subunit SA-3-like isoform X1 [Gallus gallus]
MGLGRPQPQSSSLDEEELFNMAATLRRLAAIFASHNLTPWQLLPPLLLLLQRAADTGEVPPQVVVPAITCAQLHLMWQLSQLPPSGASEVTAGAEELQSLRGPTRSFCALCQSAPERQRRRREGGAPQPPEVRLEALQRRRTLLAAFCKLVLYGVLELRAASDVFKHYDTFYGDFGDIVKAALVAARRMDRMEWARTVLLSLQQALEELLLEHGPDLRGVSAFGALRDLGRRLALHFGPRPQPYRTELLQIHRDGIAFALQEGPGGGPDGAPLYLPFLEVLAEFSPRLLQSDRALIVVVGQQPPPQPHNDLHGAAGTPPAPPAPPSPQTSVMSSIMEEEEEEVTPPGGGSSSGETPRERLGRLQDLFDSDILSIED